MKNVIFISPNFPTNYWQFCRELKNNGMNVLGIGDAPYDELTGELRDSLTAGSTGWNPTTSTGWSVTLGCAPIFTSPPVSRAAISPGSSSNPG